MCRRCREILYSFLEEEKLPKLSEEKPSSSCRCWWRRRRRRCNYYNVRADNSERDSHKPFATLKVSFSLRAGGGGEGGGVMKNLEHNFCWNTVSIRTESRKARRQKYLARGLFVLNWRERRYSRSVRPQYYEIFRYSLPGIHWYHICWTGFWREVVLNCAREIWVGLNIDVSGITVKRKKPYVDKLQDLLKSCTYILWLAKWCKIHTVYIHSHSMLLLIFTNIFIHIQQPNLHSRNIFIHIYLYICYPRLYLLTFTRCLHSHSTSHIHSHSRSKYSFNIFCASPLRIGQYKPWTAEYGLRTGYKTRTGYKRRTGY